MKINIFVEVFLVLTMSVAFLRSLVDEIIFDYLIISANGCSLT